MKGMGCRVFYGAPASIEPLLCFRAPTLLPNRAHVLLSSLSLSFNRRASSSQQWKPSEKKKKNSSCPGVVNASLHSVASDDEFLVVNFYSFMSIEDPGFEVSRHLSFLQLEGGISHLPLLDPAMRATPLSPSEWREKLHAAGCVDESSSKKDSSGPNRKFLLLDVRNGYEWDIGHFQGAQRPDVDCFRSTSYGLSEAELASSDPLATVDKEQTDILMYCTGGIRCDVYSAILRCCSGCVEELRGCCCWDCTSAPRLRPVLSRQQRYQKWHIYRDGEVQSESMA
ncbi:hypothetical protein QJS10_CPB11g02282 [Acorus calamus]|uniref:Rhodanese domain-containing protein n=1 Tax=Acorus calamus TaxID=4465 RepID=A0AAV9DSF6_ACOCL|nr:hypothetical protein QJS10_CPB11g02282 [Acorus calamus]